MSQDRYIAHQVLFKFKQGFDWNSPKARQAEQATLRHPLEIPEIKAWYCGRSLIPRTQAADFSLIGYFSSREDLAAYMVHPDHMRGVELWREISTWTVSDIDVEMTGLAAPSLALEGGA